MSDKMDKRNAAPAALSDEQRVKVLSPSMMVFKRFIRNRLAITGFCILVVMFVFSFLGGLFSPYSQAQVFKKYETMYKDYAGGMHNTELRYVVKDGYTFGTADGAQFTLAMNAGKSSFESGGRKYAFVNEGDGFYRISQLEELGSIGTLKGLYVYKFEADDALKAAFQTAFEAGEDVFSHDGAEYFITRSGKTCSLGRSADMAVASPRVFDAETRDEQAVVSGFDFCYAALGAIDAKADTFATPDGAVYAVSYEGDDVLITLDGAPFAASSSLIIRPVASDVFLNAEFKGAARAAIRAGEKEFSMGEARYTVGISNNSYVIKAEAETQLINMYDYPSAAHLLGTDSNGMDVLTRLMYGGRISLMVGFVVVLIEMLIGILIGGVSGYFGGPTDTFLMRFVDLFNCIPYWPMMIIAGAVMDTLEVDPTARIFLLMLIMGLMGWTGVARVVRGQILALREQDFMIATEATGLRVSKRIFRHLVPNVMPLLIVQATMGLGSIIITEATLSFLGLGVKYPMASWGSIINSATNLHVMTNYWFMWIPAGCLILLTVLGFNFVGDGLRDAFDPKMRR